MLSLGVVAIDEQGKTYGEFLANLQPLVWTDPDPETAEWWRQQSAEALGALANPEPRLAGDVMKEFVLWVSDFKTRFGLVVFAAWPAAYDLPYIAYYAKIFTGEQPVRRTFCIKSAAQTILGFPFDEGGKRSVPESWKGDARYNHTAIGDAREQANILVGVLERARDLRRSKLYQIP